MGWAVPTSRRNVRPDHWVLLPRRRVSALLFSHNARCFGDFYFYTGISRGKRSLDRHGHWTLQFAHTWHVIHVISPQGPTIDTEGLDTQTNTDIIYTGKHSPYSFLLSSTGSSVWAFSRSASPQRRVDSMIVDASDLPSIVTSPLRHPSGAYLPSLIDPHHHHSAHRIHNLSSLDHVMCVGCRGCL